MIFLKIAQWDLLTTSVLFGIVQALYIIFFFALKRRYLSHKFLVVLIFVLLVMLTESFLLHSGYAYYVPHVLLVTIPCVFLLGPLSLLYTKSQLNSLGFVASSLLHFIPFLGFFAYSFYFFLQSAEFKRMAYLQTFRPSISIEMVPPAFSVDPLHIRGWIIVELLSLHLFVYGLANLYITIKKNNASNSLSKKTLRWLLSINSILIFSAVVLFLSQGGVVDGYIFLSSPFPYFSPDLVSVLAMYLIVFFIIGSPRIFDNSKNKYANSPLPEYYKKEKLKQIVHLMKEQKLYLNQDFSLGMLSKESGIRPHNISQIINEGLQINFLELTNNYRIADAKQILKAKKKVNVEELAYSLGYKSKTTFYKAFKKITGVTPLQYQKRGGE